MVIISDISCHLLLLFFIKFIFQNPRYEDFRNKSSTDFSCYGDRLARFDVKINVFQALC